MYVFIYWDTIDHTVLIDFAKGLLSTMSILFLFTEQSLWFIDSTFQTYISANCHNQWQKEWAYRSARTDECLLFVKEFRTCLASRPKSPFIPPFVRLSVRLSFVLGCAVTQNFLQMSVQSANKTSINKTWQLSNTSFLLTWRVLCPIC